MSALPYSHKPLRSATSICVISYVKNDVNNALHFKTTQIVRCIAACLTPGATHSLQPVFPSQKLRYHGTKSTRSSYPSPTQQTMLSLSRSLPICFISCNNSAPSCYQIPPGFGLMPWVSTNWICKNVQPKSI